MKSIRAFPRATAKYVYGILPFFVKRAVARLFFYIGGSFGRSFDEAIRLDLEVSQSLRNSGSYDFGVRVGAHKGQEASLYEAMSAELVLWIEADSLHIPELKRRLKNTKECEHRVVQAAQSDQDGLQMRLH